jgi:SAM-dependent methyltransferase
MDVATTAKTLLEHWRSLWEQPVPGWCLSELEGRIHRECLPWDYEELVRHEFGFAGSALDLTAGGGEFLRSLEDDLPVEMHATEGWRPNLPLACANLEPLGVEVREHDCECGEPLPYPDASVDLVLCRDKGYAAREVARVLRPGGWFVTQQVEGHSLDDLAEVFGGGPAHPAVTLPALRREAEEAGLIIERAEAWHGPIRFDGVDTLVSYLRYMRWQLPADFSVERHADALVELHEREEPLVFTERRCLLVARLPEPEPRPADPFANW